MRYVCTFSTCEDNSYPGWRWSFLHIAGVAELVHEEDVGVYEDGRSFGDPVNIPSDEASGHERHKTA